MKKTACFATRVGALLTVLMLLCATAFAAPTPRYPAKLGDTTDAAAVLSEETVSDLTAYNKLLDDDAGIKLIVATVDFLDGASVDDYAEGLRQAWKLDDDELLLLMAVGEDKFTSVGGKDVNERLSVNVQQKLLSVNLESAFLAQDYDGALRSYIPALTREVNKAWGENIQLGGLFGVSTATAAPVTVDEWVDRFTQSHIESTTESFHDRVTEEDNSSGYSLGKVILIVLLLLVIFGGGKKKGRRSGCGCAPFSSILAGLGIWKLLDDDHHKHHKHHKHH